MVFMNSVIDQIPNISKVTKIEVLSFNAAAEHYQLLTIFMKDANVIDLSNDIVEACINLCKNH